MRRLSLLSLGLVLFACRSQVPSASREGTAPVATQVRVDAGAPLLSTRPGLLAEIGRRFGAGISPTELAHVAGAPPPVQKGGKDWTIEVATLGLELSVDATAAAAPATWIRAHVTPGAVVMLSEVAGVFGKYRKLPPGEYTWVMFEQFRPAEVTVSASALSAGDEETWRVARIQFQRPAPRPSKADR